jgi:hypothetical protein
LSQSNPLLVFFSTKAEKFSLHIIKTGVYIMENTPPPGGGEISADVNWGKKYEKTKRKRRKMWKKREERGKKKEEREKKIRKEEAKGKNKCKIGKN